MSIKMRMAGIFVAAALVFPMGAQALTMEEKVELQLLLVSHLKQESEDGLFVFQDAVTSETRRLYAANLHPKVLDFGEIFVLCADFYEPDGTRVEVDFLTVTEKGETRIDKVYSGQRKSVMSMLIAQYGKPVK